MIAAAALAVVVLATAYLSFTALAMTPPAANSNADTDYTPPVSFVEPTVVFIGDSFTGGSDMGGYGDTNWTAITSEILGWRDCAFGVGGSGWTRGANDWTFGARIDWAIAQHPSLVVFSNGINDVRENVQSIGPAAAEALGQMRSKAPDIPVLVVGPIAVQDFPSLGFMNDSVAAAARANDAQFIDAVQTRWFRDDAAQFIGTDKFHPTDAGHVYLAEQFAASVQSLGIELADIPKDDRLTCTPPNPSTTMPDGTSVDAD